MTLNNRDAYHLCNAKAMPKVVKRDLVVVLVGLVQEVPENVDVDGELGAQVEVQEHLLEQQQQLFVLPLPAVERRHTQPLPHRIRHLCVTLPRSKKK